MEYYAIGPELNLISRLGFGCAPVSGYDYGSVDECAWSDAVRASLENGINVFDVADVYGFGRAEELLSQALGEKRHDVVLASKFGLAWDAQARIKRDSSPRQAERALESSLRRLRVDCITLYQLHWPDDCTPLSDTLETLSTFRNQGKIRFIGLSNIPFWRLEMEILSDYVDFIQVPYNLLCREIENGFLSQCVGAETKVLAHSPLARGFLSGKHTPGEPFEVPDTRGQSAYFSRDGEKEKNKLIDALRRIGAHHNCSASAVALRWTLDRRELSSVLVGIKDRTQLEDNLRAIGLRLSLDERELLAALSSACPGVFAGSLARRAVN